MPKHECNIAVDGVLTPMEQATAMIMREGYSHDQAKELARLAIDSFLGTVHGNRMHFSYGGGNNKVLNMRYFESSQ